jgi:hypothetical protein
MTKKVLLIMGSLAVLAWMTGCVASLNDVVRAKKDGTAKVYSVTCDQAWEICKAVFHWEGARAIEEHKAEGYMVTSTSMNWDYAAGVMAAWMEPIDKDNTRVTVVIKRKRATDISMTLPESIFHDRFAQAVDIVKAGKPLPVISP